MGRLILCYSNKAKKPYYIKNMNINLYTIEELCYYLHHNIYLIDENVINDELILWIGNELNLTKLSELLRNNRISMKGSIMHILTFTGYISDEEVEETQKLLSVLEGQGEVEKKILRADHLLKCKKYVEAILEYQSLVEEVDVIQKEKIWNNMGVAYACMFLYCESANCFKKAYETNFNEDIHKQYQYAVAMGSKEEVLDFIQEIKEDNNSGMLNEELVNLLSPDFNSKRKQLRDVLNYKNENQIALYYKGLEELLGDWKKEYINLTL